MRNRLLSCASASALAFATQAVLAFGVAEEAQAQTIMSFGPNNVLNEQRKAPDGAAGRNNTQPGCSGTSAGGAGGTVASQTTTMAYAPTDPAATHNGGIAVVGRTGGNGGRGGSDSYDNGCVYDGGAGGAGSAGGTVSLTLNSGGNAPADGYKIGNTAVVAYSHGGTGGAGGDTTRKEMKGGDGGAGGAGGSVTIVNHVALNVTGASAASTTTAFGIVAQSAGGQGGDGGYALNGNKKSAGGSGVAGGAGGAVSITNDAAITTAGGMAIVGQSIGGFGGDAGTSVSGYGGGGGFGGHGGAVSIANSGRLIIGSASAADCSDTITTRCNASGMAAIGAQSVGGGGGDAGAAAGLHALGASGGFAGNGGAVSITSSGSLLVHGSASTGLFAQSGGGGGGKGGMAFASGRTTTAIGGSGGGGGAGGMVTVNNSSAICTGDACADPAKGVNDSAGGAVGIFAQSVGGGGGIGGFAQAKSNSVFGGSAHAVGGSGGSGGAGGYVGVLNRGSIATVDINSAGVLAQSVGGGGGSGGGAISMASAIFGSAVSVSHGGTGGSGGNGGNVAINCLTYASLSSDRGVCINTPASLKANAPATSMNITTAGDASAGMIAQSIGGGGGNGGYAISLSASVTGAMSLSFGGSGGSGGTGGKGGVVTITASRGSILSTSGAMAHGMLAQSVGGGGGHAGAANGTSADGGNANIAMALGGSSGSSQHGGAIGIINDGTIATGGAGASAILAQSVAAGGGAALTQLTTGSGGRSNATLKLGATGNANGDGGVVTLYSDFNPAAYTAGYSDLINAFGTNNAVAQEHYLTDGIGRISDGFNAAQYSANYADVQATFGTDLIGAANHYITTGRFQGRTAARLPGAPDATTPPFGQLSTSGDQANAIVAQSIGAGGGLAIVDVDRTRVGNGIDANLTLGADSGGVGGRANQVTVIMGNGPNAGLASLTTKGMASSGIVAQAIGGGGGVTSFASSTVASGNAVNLNLKLGTGAHGHNEGGKVDVGVGYAVFDIGGMNSFGIAAQSIGGGGGLAAFTIDGLANNATANGTLGQYDSDNNSSQAVGREVRVYSRAAITMRGLQSTAILAQSIGAGGGAVSAGSTSLDIFSGTTTLGAQGGKGGQDGGNVTVSSLGAINTELFSPAIVAQSIAGGGGLSLIRQRSVDLGGNPNGTSGTVSVTNGASITTKGTASIGIVAQSIAGGGGLAIATNSASLGGAESGSNGGKVVVTSNGAITTYGINAVGILAQSVGGGGGAVITEGAPIATTWVKGTGNASDVTVTINAPITTYGINAPGVIAQSVAGGGGLVMDGASKVLKSAGGGGRSGVVRVYQNANIITYGAGSSAIIGTSSNDPIIEIAKDVQVIGGSGGSALLLDSPINEISNAGHLSTLDGAAGQTVQVLSGDTSFTNSGSLTGSIALAQGGTNLLHNLAGGRINAGAALDLGGGTLRNDGLLGNGGSSVGKTVINGSLLQSDTASLAIRINHATGEADAFEITGTGKLAGTLRPTLLGQESIKPGTVLKTILSTAGDLDISDLKIANDSAILEHALRVEDGQVVLATKVDFAPEGVSADGAIIGRLIANAQASGQPHFGRVVPRLLDISGKVDLDQAYYNLSGAGTSSVSTVGTQISTAFMTMLTGLPGGFAGEGRTSLWGQAFNGSGNVSGRGAIGMGDLSARVRGLAMGIARQIGTGTGSLLGIGVSMGSTDFNTASGVMGKSDVYQLGLYGTHRLGATYLSATLAGGRHDLSTGRSLPLIEASYAAEFRGWSYGGRVEVGYRIDRLIIGISPYAAIQALEFTTPAYSETAGANAPAVAALSYAKRSTTDARFEVGAALDKLFTLDRGRQLALRGRAAWVHRHSSNPDVRASFHSVTPASFRVGGAAPVADLILLSADAELRLGRNLIMGARFDGEIAGRSRTYRGAGMVSYHW